MEVKKWISIEFRGLNIEQLYYIQTKVMPAINKLLCSHLRQLKELGGAR